MHYTINPINFAVNIYDGTNDEPFWYQPDYPNGDKFDSVEEATNWAELAMKSHDPSYGFYAPAGKGLTGDAKPDLEAIEQARLSAIHKLKNLGLTDAEISALQS
jgi:hypothetical protein